MTCLDNIVHVGKTVTRSDGKDQLSTGCHDVWSRICQISILFYSARVRSCFPSQAEVEVCRSFDSFEELELAVKNSAQKHVF